MLDLMSMADSLYALRHRVFPKKDRSSKTKPEITRHGYSSSPKGIWFLPAHVYDSPNRTKVFPGSAYIVRIHGDAIVKDPREIKYYLEDVYGHARERIETGEVPPNARVCGSSLGGLLALLVANRHPSDALFLRAPGGDLPETIRDSTKVGGIYRKGVKIFGSTSFNEHLDHLSPINNVDNLPQDIDIRILRGGHDGMISPEQGELLVRKIKEAGHNLREEVRVRSGHIVSYAPTNLFD